MFIALFPPLGLLETVLRWPKPPQRDMVAISSQSRSMGIIRFAFHFIYRFSTTPLSFRVYLPLPVGLKLLVWVFVCSLVCFRWSSDSRWLFPYRIYVTPLFNHHSPLHVSLDLWFAWMVLLWVACFAPPKKIHGTRLQGTKECPVESTAGNPELIRHPTFGSAWFASGLSSRTHFATSPEPQKQKLTDAAYHFDIIAFLVSVIKHLLWLFDDILGLPIRPLQAMVGLWVGVFFVLWGFVSLHFPAFNQILLAF